MKRLFVTIISISLSLSILLMSVSAFDTPYKELSRRERAELPEFQSFEVSLSTNIPLDITEYEGEGPFDLNGVRVKSVEFSFDATDIGIELYDYKVLVDEASYNSVYEAKEIWVENESVIGVVTFSTYGNGDKMPTANTINMIISYRKEYILRPMKQTTLSLDMQTLTTPLLLSIISHSLRRALLLIWV